MRIVFVLGSSHIGGTELNTLRMATALVRRGHHVTQILIGQPGSLLDRFESSGAQLVQVPSRSLTHPGIVRTVRQVADAIRLSEAEVVHTHDVYANILAVPAARMARSPVVLSSRRWWKATPRRVHRYLNRIAYAISDATVANAPSVASMLSSDERLPAGKVHVIPNLLDESLLSMPDQTDRSAIRQELGVRPGSIAVMCIARLVHIKNHRMLLRAFSGAAARIPELQLLLVGGGPLQADLEQLARETGITGSVIFLGERQDAARCYGAADIAVLTSFSEGMPNSLLEAMACGLPVISTAVGGAVDIVQPGITGTLVTSDDHVGLGRALVDLANKPDVRSTMGHAGRCLVHEIHSEVNVMRELEELYRRFLTRASAAA